MISEARAAAVPVESNFKQVLNLNNLQGEWRIIEGQTAAVLSADARYADLLDRWPAGRPAPAGPPRAPCG